MSVRIEWTGTGVPAEYTDVPGAIVDGYSTRNDGAALLIHSGSGDGVCVEGESADDIVRWLRQAIETVLNSKGKPIMTYETAVSMVTEDVRRSEPGITEEEAVAYVRSVISLPGERVVGATELVEYDTPLTEAYRIVLSQDRP
jgi:hypothetical protein